jgi:cysteine desulfurase
MRIYLDHNATTPLRAEVFEAMTRVLRDEFGNPSSTHAEGAAARKRVERAREQVAAALGVAPEEVVFTAGATEANNAVLAGFASRRRAGEGRTRIVTSRVEHPSVLEPCERLEDAGMAVTRLEVDSGGLLDLADLDEALARGDAALVTLIWANNETGVIQPLEAVAARATACGVPLHVDATQVLGKLPLDFSEMPVALASFSAHKLGGPKGVGALMVRRGSALPPLLAGGPQERGRRGGTENVASIVGFGVACELARSEQPLRAARHAALRDRLWQGLRMRVPEARWNGAREHVLPNTLNVEIPGVAGEVLLQALDLEGVAASAGAACHSGSITPSHVLAAMGRSSEQARSSLRLSLGHGVDEAQIDRVVELLGTLVVRARRAHPS